MLDVKQLLSISEDYKAPERLKEILLCDANVRNKVFDSYCEQCPDLSTDGFNEYFQTQNSDRKNLMQDYTPVPVCKLVSMLTGNDGDVIDLCAGTGSLTIPEIQKNSGRVFNCIEYSEMAFWFLTFNLAVRNVNARVARADALTGHVYDGVTLSKSDGKYSEISETGYSSIGATAPNVVMNPPYSQKWEPKQIGEFEPAPKSKADLAFVERGIEMLDPGGTLVAVLPHGVLFRGNQEAEIRKQLCESGYLKTVIGLPEKMFLNTGIPVCILVIKKEYEDTGVLFVDASNDFVKGGKQNAMTDAQVERVRDAVNGRGDIDKYCHLAEQSELIENEYNMNIPRYVDTSEYEDPPDLYDTLNEMTEIEREIMESRNELIRMMKQMTFGNAEDDAMLKQALKRYEKLNDEQMKLVGM